MSGRLHRAITSITVEDVLACLGDVLDRRPSELSADTPLIELGLESFTAVRLRRRLHEETSLDLPLTAFLGAATARTLATGMAEPAGAPSATPADDSFPLTPVQAAYLVGRDPSFPLGGVATFYYYEFDRVSPGDPHADLDRLTTAWNQLVARHPMLRMVISSDARQRILPGVPRYVIEVTDLRDAGHGEADARLHELRYQCSHQVRPTGQWPLFDIRAAMVPDGRTRLFLGFDVLALDLASWMQLMREWGYLVAHPHTVLPPIPITFAELMARRAADPAQQQQREADLAYWEPRAAQLPAGPVLPWSHSAMEPGIPRMTRYPAELTAEEWVALRHRAAQHRLSPTGTLLAAFALVLHSWGATEPFCLNTTLFDRTDIGMGEQPPGLDAVVGDFTSTALVEIPELNLVTWSGFGAFAAAVNRQFWADLDHRSISGVEVARLAMGEKAMDGASGPRHPVVFTSGVGLIGADDPPLAWLGKEVFGVSQTPQVLLDHIVWDEGGRLRFAWDAVDGMLPDGFVAAMLAAQIRLLRRLAFEQSAWSDPALGWDPSFRPDEPLLVTPFGQAGPLLDDPLRTAATDPQPPALISTDRAVTREELAQRTRRTATSLSRLGAGPGELIALAAEKGMAQVTALLGVSASGAAYVPVEPSWPAARVAAVCEQAGIKRALAGPGVTTEWPAGVSVHVLDGHGVLGGPPGEDPPRRPEPDDLAYVIFTSGSTGRPKGVAIEHRAVRSTIDDLVDRFQLTEADRVLALSAFSFDLSVFDVFGVLGVGGAVVLPDADRQRDPGHWIELMRRHRVTIWNTAPALLEMLVDYAEIDPEPVLPALESLRLVMLSGDWIPVTLPGRIRALAPAASVMSLGGATEASIWSICFPIGQVNPAWRSIPYGRALRGQSFHIVGAAGRPAPVESTGELLIGGDGLARCYLGDPAQTDERFRFHPVLRRRVYRTGDLGRWRIDGTIEFLGRLDRQVKIRGHRIELGEIEAVLDRNPRVGHRIARSLPGPDGSPRLVAYVVAADRSRSPGESELAGLLRANLPEFMVPSRFVILDRLPVTDNGKIDYAALPNPYRPAETSAPRRSAPADSQPVHSGPVGAGTLEVAVAEAAARGLALRLIVSAGSLPPGQALGAAAEWTRSVSTAARQAGVTVTERFPESGLVELALDNAAEVAEPAEPEGLAASDAAFTAAAHDPHVERAVAQVFSDLLSGPVDVTTPFFRLGATSLTLVLAHRRLRAELDPELAVVDLFSRPSIRELAGWISERRAGRVAEQPLAPAGQVARGDGADPAAVAARPRERSRRVARELALELAR